MDSIKWKMLPLCLIMLAAPILVSSQTPSKSVDEEIEEYRFGYFLATLNGNGRNSYRDQITVRVTSILANPWLMESEENGNTTYKGFIKDMLDLILDKSLGLDYELYLAEDGRFGAVNTTTGLWSGTIGEVVNGDADVAAGPITVTSTRLKVVEFSQPFQFTGPVIVMRKPEKSQFQVDDRLLYILKPFESSVWLLVLMSYLMSSTIIYIIGYFNPYDWKRMARDGEATIREGESFTCINTFWFALGTMMIQGFTRAPRSVGSRIAVTAWWAFVLILIASYIGNLSNLLRTGSQPDELETYSKIRSFRDLAKDSEIKIAYVGGGSTEEFFSKSQNPDIQGVYNTMTSSRGIALPNVPEAIDRLKKSPPGSMAVIMESSLAKYYTHMEDCSLYYVNEKITTRHYSLAFPLGSALSERIDIALQTAQDNGQLATLENRWFKGQCTDYMLEQSDAVFEIPRFYPMDLGSFSGALFILALGLLIGGFVTVVEFFIFRFAESDDETKSTQNDPAGANQSLLKTNNQKGMTTV